MSFNFFNPILRKFIELCNEETPMVRRAVANRIGNLAAVVSKDIVITELIPIFKQLSSDEQVIILKEKHYSNSFRTLLKYCA